MVYFLGLGEGMAWANSYLQFTKAKQLLLRAASIDERSII